jgi:ribonuclease Z
MDVVTLGTGSPLPHPDRAGPSTLVRAGGHKLLFDAGRGVLMRLASVGLGLPAFLDRVFITHLHSDHTTDLSDLITTNWITTPTGTPLRVTGPEGLGRLVDALLVSLATDVGYRIAHHDDLTAPPSVDVLEVATGPALQLDGVTVTCALVEHAPAHPALAYRVDHDGKSVVIGGDTKPCEGLDRLCDGADVYVQTVVRPDLVTAMAAPRMHDVLDYHSSCEEAGATAARGGVGTLVLTHLVPGVAPGTEREWAELARATFDGVVVVADDLMVTTA